MIPRIHNRGKRTIGLLAYLYGPGKYEEHTDPHLVASWDDNAPDPGRDPQATLKQLQRLLDQPVQNVDEGSRPAQHVWHLSVRNAPTDRILSDEEWADVARRMVAAAGIDDPDQGAGCRWAAVRHADDHIHIIATLVREDGYKPDLDNDAQRVQDEARRLEAELGLRRLNSGDRTAAQRPTSAERHKAERTGRTRTAREELRETVRRAVAGAVNDAEFFDRLGAAGLLVVRRVAPSGDLLGYKVALPSDRNKDGEPIFYAGAKLAPDLSLPRIRQRYGGQEAPDETAVSSPQPRPSQARRSATGAVWTALLVIDQDEDGAAAAQIADVGEVLDALAKTSAAHTRRELSDAAFAFERASRSHIRAERQQDRVLRQAARDLVRGGPALGRGEDGAGTAMVIDMLFFLVITAAAWHAKRGHAQQAAAAQQTAEHLREAYRNAAAAPLSVLRERGRKLTLPLQRRYGSAMREAVPDLAQRVLDEAGWPALAATLAEAEAAGHDVVPLLTEAASRRELDTAESVSDVLVWRLRRLADLPAAAGTDSPAKGTRASTVRSRQSFVPGQGSPRQDRPAPGR
ncbi:mobilization protein [Streptomyces sp. NBC_01298]|uniref:relaxase/mobilization nuclease domain-containing protein n=1 Tax=Streptomyces sp. NBC_01298 TaxID=2903817 RepID=UPI002E0E07E4|nr:mobilization protein [Streptomyces sp. NBC_01298]